MKKEHNILDEYVEIEDLLQSRGINSYELGFEIGYDIGVSNQKLSAMVVKIANIIYKKNILGIYEPLDLRDKKIRKQVYKKLKKQKLLIFFEMIVSEAKKRVNIIDEVSLEGEESGT